MDKLNFSRKAPWLPIIIMCVLFMAPCTVVHADSLPSLSLYGIKESTLLFPEKVQGKVYAVLQGGQFIMHEKKHLICRETEINGEPASVAKYKLASGTKISITRYRLKNKNYFVSSMTILSR